LAQPPLPPDDLPVNKIGGDQGQTTFRSNGAKPQAITVQKKWNVIHAKNCWLTYDKKGNPVLNLYSTDDEDVGISSTHPEKFPVMIAQCATGNWIAFWVTKVTATSFTWTDLYTYDFKN
jgi:hypothetical protein